MKRRGFLGFIGGAAVAVPAAAKNAVTKLPGGLGLSNIAGMGAGYGGAIPSNSGDWRIEEIARLKRFLTGELTEDEKQEERAHLLRTRENLISQHAASLVSVAAVRKIDIFNREMRKLNREVDILYRSGYLTKLLREMNN